MNIPIGGHDRDAPVHVERVYCLDDLLADMLDQERAENVRLHAELQSMTQAFENVTQTFARYRHLVRRLVRGAPRQGATR